MSHSFVTWQQASRCLHVRSRNLQRADRRTHRPCRTGARKRKSRGGSSLGSVLSPELQEFLGEESLPRTQVKSPVCLVVGMRPCAGMGSRVKSCGLPSSSAAARRNAFYEVVPQVVKRIWQHIKANNLQDPKNKRVIIFGASLRRQRALHDACHAQRGDLTPQPCVWVTLLAMLHRCPPPRWNLILLGPVCCHLQTTS